MTRRIHRKKPPPPPLVFKDLWAIGGFIERVKDCAEYAENPGRLLGVWRDRAMDALRASGIECELNERGGVQFPGPGGAVDEAQGALAHFALLCGAVLATGSEMTALNLERLRKAAHAVDRGQAHVAVATVEAHRRHLNDIAPLGGAKMKEKVAEEHAEIDAALAEGALVKVVQIEREKADKPVSSERAIRRIKKKQRR